MYEIPTLHAAQMLAAAALVALAGCTTPSLATRQQPVMPKPHKEQVIELLKSIETDGSKPVAYINPKQYVQHHLGVGDGLAGFGALLQQLPKGSAKVNTVRVFQDGDLVFTHTDYNFFSPKVGFDIFRFENGKIAEHWDTIETIPPQAEWNNTNGKF